MRAGAFLRAAESLPFGNVVTLAGTGGLVVIAPHADDESLGCGGLIAEARAQRREVRIVVVSDGTGSHPGSVSYPPERLRRLRRDEALAAAGVLGVPAAAVIFLNLSDRHVPDSGPIAEAAAAQLAAIARSIAAQALFVTWEHDPHADHRAANAIARMAARLARTRVHAYPIWGWNLPARTEVGGPPRGVRFPIARHLPAKHAAVQAHRSQTTDLIDDDPAGFRLPPEVWERFERPFEIFLEQVP